jgi:hypothetical protein
MNEFNNQGALMGVGDRIGSYDYQTFVNLVLSGNSDVPSETVGLLKSAKLKIRPLRAYQAVLAGTQSKVEVLPKSGDKVVGISNIKDRKPLKNELFMITGMTLLSAETTAGALGDVLYKPLEETATHDVYTCGECKLVIGGQVIFDEMPNQAFVSKGDTNVTQGLFLFDKPIFVNDTQDIEFEIAPAAVTALTVNTALKVIFHGLKASVK